MRKESAQGGGLVRMSDSRWSKEDLHTLMAVV